MRLLKKGRLPVMLGNEQVWCALRPLKGEMQNMAHGEYVQDTLRLLFPWRTVIHPGDRVEIGGDPYRCLAVRAYPGHVQADVRRCSR